MPEAHPQNVAGPFYVENGCCITCGVPEDIAPDLFAWAEGESHCFVKCQPQPGEQLDRMMDALWSAEADCIRYRGDDSSIAQRIVNLGKESCCDSPPPTGKRVIRDHVNFRASGVEDAAALADAFRKYLEQQNRDQDPQARAILGDRYLIRSPGLFSSKNRVSFSWDQRVSRRPHFKHVTFVKLDAGFGARLGRERVARTGLALLLHDWLQALDGVDDIVWRSADEVKSQSPGFHRPI